MHLETWITLLNKKIHPDHPVLMVTLEKIDFVDGVGHRFIRDLRLSLIGFQDDYYTEEVQLESGGKQLVWLIDSRHLKLFIALFKKHYKNRFTNQIIYME